MIKDENFVQIAGWMRNRLGLSGNNLLCFALIYGFSQDGETCFSGSLKYLYEFLGASKSTAMRSLEMLEDLGLIVKESQTINGVKFNKYRANLSQIDDVRKMIPPVSNCDRGGIILKPGRYQNETGGGFILKPNNIVNNKEDNKEETNSGPEIFDTPVIVSPEKAPPVAPPPPESLILPFDYPEFVQAWKDWKEYKWLQHKDKYKTLKSEQIALNQLRDKAGNSPVIAIQIINNSIGNLYKGLFEIKGNGYKAAPQLPTAPLPDAKTHTPDQLQDYYAFNQIEHANKNATQQ